MKMREININIEGFNVNGICVGCLNYNRKMYHNHRDEFEDFLKSLCNIEVPSGILLQICWECQAHLTNVMKFRKQVLKSYEALLEYSRQKTFLNSPTDFIRQATNRLAIGKVDRDDIYPEVEGNKFEDECSMADDRNDFKSETEDFDVNIGDRNDIHPQIEVNKLEDECSMADNRNVIKSETEDFDADDIDVAGGCTRDATSRTTKLNLYPQNEVNKCSMVDNKNGFKGETDDIDVNGVHEEPIKDESDSSEALVNILPNGKNRKVVPTKRKKKLRKKRRSSKDETDQLKSAITTINLTEEELQKERQDFSINTEFKNADFKCQNCLISFKSKEGLDEHNLLNHCLSGDYTCTVCSSVLSSRRLHKDHLKLHFTRYECSLCGKRWRLDGDEVVSSEQLEAHVTTDHRCHVCGAVYLSKEDQHKHTCSKSRIKCPLCERTFSHRAGLMNHRMAMHEAKVEYSCKTCGKKFRWKNSLKRHMEKHDQKSSAQAPAAYCETCRISFNYICSYQRHLRNSLKHVTHDQLRFICDHCNRKFADKTKLRYHIEEKHLHKTYLCEFCFKPSKNRSHLEQHIRNVHIGRPNNKMCNHCGKGFPTKVQLECHIRSHTGERPFICEYCPTTFTQQSNLYKHKRQVHLNIKSKRYPTQKKKKEDVNQPPTADQCLITWT